VRRLSWQGLQAGGVAAGFQHRFASTATVVAHVKRQRQRRRRGLGLTKNNAAPPSCFAVVETQQSAMSAEVRI